MKECQIKRERQLAKLTEALDFITSLMNTSEVGKKKEKLSIWKIA